MTKVLNIKGLVALSDIYKANNMYLRGKSFLRSAILLEENSEKDFPFFHLFCLGLEIILKASLLVKNYPYYSSITHTPKGKRKNKEIKYINHDLIIALEYFEKEYQEIKIDEGTKKEIEYLNNFYKQFKLRYASILDIALDPNSIEFSKILKFIQNVLKTMDRIFEQRINSINK